MIKFKQKLTFFGFYVSKTDMFPVSFCTIGFNKNEVRRIRRKGSPKKQIWKLCAASPHRLENPKGLKIQVLRAHAFI